MYTNHTNDTRLWLKKRGPRLLGLLALIVLAGAVMRSAFQPGLLGMRTATPPGNVDASGVITAEEIALSSAQGGRIATFYVAEGDRVKAGQELVALDTALLEAQLDMAKAQLAVAQAGLKQMEAGARPGAMAVAEARLAQAKAAYPAAVQALADAQALRAHPQELDMQIAVAEMEVEAAEHCLQSAVALKDAAEVAKNALEYTQDQLHHWPYPMPPPKLPQELESAAYDWWKAWAGVNAASASLNEAQAQLAHWRKLRDDPQELNAQVDMAQAAVAQAAAAVDAAQAQLDAYQAGASQEQLSAARARVAQAQAALDALLAQREEMVVVAPMDGLVLSRAAHAGEVIAPGGKLLSLANLAEVRLTVYVAENRLGEVALNQKVLVTVDSFPGRTLEGRVVRIADRAQYTPRNVATKEERVNTVYAVEIALPNAEGLLKPGMPADARLVAATSVTSSTLSMAKAVTTSLGHLFSKLSAASGHTVQANNPLEASGVIQAEEIRIASEFQGFATQVPVQAGDRIATGQVLVVLDSSTVQSNVRQAQAALQTAQADLALVRARPRAEEVAAKRAQLAVAQAERDRAYAAWQAALHALQEPQELQQQMLKAEAQVALAVQNVQLAEADYYQARYAADHAEWNSTERHVLEFQAAAAKAALAAAQADERAAQAALQHLQGIQEQPLVLQAKVHAAEGEYRVAEAAMGVVQAELDDLLAGATAEEVAVAEANLAVAQAQLRLAQTQLERLTLRAPVDGTVVERMINNGETAMPGVTLLTVADLSAVYLTVYVPEDRVGEVYLGQTVDATVDSFPQQRFAGQVVHIADQPQYTPRNVATKEERVNTVYGVKIRLPNPEGLLKPGMAAEALTP